MAQGHIYVMKNQAFSLLKIGKSERDPSERAQELTRHSGVPFKFEVAFSVHTTDIDRAERMIHNLLADYRANDAREFFEVSLERAKDAIERVVKIVGEFDGPMHPSEGPEHYRSSGTSLALPPDDTADEDRKRWEQMTLRERDLMEAAKAGFNATEASEYADRKERARDARAAAINEMHRDRPVGTKRFAGACVKCGHLFTVTIARSKDQVACPSCLEVFAVPVDWS